MIKLWDVAIGEINGYLEHGNYNDVHDLAFSPDGRLLAGGGTDSVVRIWDVESGQVLRSLPHADELLAVSFSPDGAWLATGGYDNTVVIWGIPR